MKKTKLNYPTEGAIHDMHWYEDQIKQNIKIWPLHPFDDEIHCEIEKEIVYMHYQKLKKNEIGSFMYNQKHLVLSAEVTDEILIDFGNYLRDRLKTSSVYQLSTREYLREFFKSIIT